MDNYKKAVGSSQFVFSCLSSSKYFIMHHEQIYKHKLTQPDSRGALSVGKSKRAMMHSLPIDCSLQYIALNIKSRETRKYSLAEKSKTHDGTVLN